MTRNLLTINTEKTVYKCFGRARHQQGLNISVNNAPISRVRTYKYLGHMIDEELTFKHHVDLVKKKIRPFIGVMWRTGRYIPQSFKKILYHSLVSSHLN